MKSAGPPQAKRTAPIPAPRLTLWAAGLIALALSALWLIGLGTWHLLGAL